MLSQYDAPATDKLHRQVLDAFRTSFRDEFDYLVLLWDVDAPPPSAPVGMFQRNIDGQLDRCVATVRTDCPRLLGTVAITFSLSTSGMDAFNGGPLLHEMAHAVGNFVLPTTFPSHWGYASVWGQLGGWNPATFKDLGGGQYQVDPFGAFANGGNSIPYAPLELYLLGLLAESDVPAVRVANDFQWVDPAKGIFAAGSFSTFTARQIGDMLGDKRPDMAMARKNFRVAAVVLTAHPRLPDEKALHLSTGAAFFTYSAPLTEYQLSTNSRLRASVVNFRAATRSLADVRMAGVSTFAK